MSEPKVPFHEVEEFVRWMVKLGGIYDVDSDGYVIRTNDDSEPVLIKSGNVYRPLLILKEQITDNDAVVINPFNESSSESPDGKWLYTTLAVGLAKRLVDIVRYARFVIENVEDENIQFDPAIIKFCSKHNGLDAKAMEYFGVISDDLIEFVNVWYDRRLKKTRSRCSLFDPDTKTRYPGVSAKAWNTLTNLIADLLDIDPKHAEEQMLEKYSATSDKITVPKLESMLKVYLKLYSRLNQFLDCVDNESPDYVPDLTSMGAYLNRLDLYYDRAKWFAGVVQVECKTATPGNVTNVVEPAGIPSNQGPIMPMQPFAEPDSSIPSNVHRRGIEYASQQPPMPSGFPSNQMGGGFPSNPMGGGGFFGQAPAPSYGGGFGTGFNMGGGGIPIR